MRPAVEVLNQGWGNGTSTTPVNAAGLKGYWLKNPTLHENSLCPETLQTILSQALEANGMP